MINYILLAHKDPEQVKYLVNKLDNNAVRFYIHIDKLVNIKPFTELFLTQANVCFIKEENRENGTWCDIAIVKATINCLKEIILDNQKGYCYLLSGQDYPVKSNQYIHDFLNTNYGKEFIEVFKIPTENWFEKGLDRLNKYKFNLSNKRGHFVVCSSIYESSFYNLKTAKSIVKLVIARKKNYLFKLLKKRRKPNYIEHYGGSQWWCLTIETIKAIVNFIDQNPDYLAYHEFSLLPDEMFFQSIIMTLNKKTICESLTFVDWERENSTGAPTLTNQDFKLLLHLPPNKLIARKFDFKNDYEIINRLNSLCN